MSRSWNCNVCYCDEDGNVKSGLSEDAIVEIASDGIYCLVNSALFKAFCIVNYTADGGYHLLFQHLSDELFVGLSIGDGHDFDEPINSHFLNG